MSDDNLIELSKETGVPLDDLTKMAEEMDAMRAELAMRLSGITEDDINNTLAEIIAEREGKA